MIFFCYYKIFCSHSNGSLNLVDEFSANLRNVRHISVHAPIFQSKIFIILWMLDLHHRTLLEFFLGEKYFLKQSLLTKNENVMSDTLCNVSKEVPVDLCLYLFFIISI